MTAGQRLTLVSLLSMVTLLVAVQRRSPAAPVKVLGPPMVYVRTGPGTDFRPVGVVSSGVVVDTIERDGAWTKVDIGDGRVGWVYGSYLVPETADAADASETPAAAPAGATAPEREPAGSPVPDFRDGDALSEELANLKSEVADLKRQVAEQGAPEPTVAGAAPTAESPAAEVAPPNAADSPAEGAAPPDAGEPNVRIVAVAAVSLGIGWMLGAGFSRRRSRNQRARLRF